MDLVVVLMKKCHARIFFFCLSEKWYLSYRVRNNFRCGIEKGTARSGIFPLRAFPILHRKLFLTVWKLIKIMWRIYKQFIIISKNRKTVNKISTADMPWNKLHSRSPFSHRFLQNIHQKIRKGSYFMNSTS